MPAVTVGDVYQLASADGPQAFDGLKQLYEWRQTRWFTTAKGTAGASAAAVAATIAESLKSTTVGSMAAPEWVFAVVSGWALLLILAASYFQYIAAKAHCEFPKAVPL